MATINGTGGDNTINGNTDANNNDVISGLAGNDVISGLSGNDRIYGGDDNDTIYGDAGTDTLYGDLGNDVLFGGNDTLADTLYGGDGDDTLDGGQGNDRLYGGNGNDLIYAGAFGNPDSDSMDGGAGQDTVDFSQGNEGIDIGLGATGNDVFNPGGNNDTDSLVGIEHIIGTNFDDTIAGNTDANMLYGGANDDILSGGDNADTLYGGSEADDLSGDAGADLLYGGTGADAMDGGAGADLLYGDAGADNMAGGADADTLYGGSEADVVAGDAGADILYGDAGTDTVQGGDNNDILYGGTEADRLQGGNNDDTLYGGDAADSMSGDAGNDVMVGGAGADTMDGGAGTDTADYSGSASGVNVTINASGNTGGDAADDTLAGIENLTGSTSADTLVGDNGANVILGLAGADTIDAAGGSDSVAGGADADTIEGGIGNDTIDGGTGDDFITGGPTVAGSGTAVPLDFNWSAIGADNTDITNVTQDTGGINVNVTLTDPGTNFDLFDVQTSGNIFVDAGEPFNTGSSGELRRTGSGDPTVVDINFSAVSGSGFEEEVENVQFRISDMDDAGWRDRVVIRAWDADGNPVDVVFSDTTADISVDGDTVFVEPGAGQTVATDEEGSFLVTIAGPVARIEISYDNLETDAQVIYVSDIHFDGILVEGDNDSITGDTGNDTILGAIGDDTLLGGIDNDILYGGDGNDSLNGNEGNDTLLGDAGTDTLRGAAGNDTFLIQDNAEVAAAGNDIIYGGGGAEEGGTGAGEDTVTDYDVIDLSSIGTARITVNYTNTDPENLVGTVIIYTDATKTVEVGRIDFSEIEKVILCFTPGTLIETERGAVAVETLRAGDMVVTRDNGLQPLRWTGARKLSYAELQAKPDLQPVRIAKGALAEGPVRTMLVSPQHRVMIEAARAEMLFGEAEVLVPAKHLVGQVEASRALPADGVTYIHLLFDQHEMVLSDGIWTESFQPAERSLNAMDDEVRAEIVALFPELQADADGYQAARMSLKAHEAKVLLGK